MASASTLARWDERRNQNIMRDSVTISFSSRKVEDDAFYELLLNRMPVRSAGLHKYIINKKGQEILNSENIKYEIVK